MSRRGTFILLSQFYSIATGRGEGLEKGKKSPWKEKQLGDLELSLIKDFMQEDLERNLGHIPLFLKVFLLSIHLVCIR